MEHVGAAALSFDKCSFNNSFSWWLTRACTESDASREASRMGVFKGPRHTIRHIHASLLQLSFNITIIYLKYPLCYLTYEAMCRKSQTFPCRHYGVMIWSGRHLALRLTHYTILTVRYHAPFMSFRSKE